MLLRGRSQAARSSLDMLGPLGSLGNAAARGRGAAPLGGLVLAAQDAHGDAGDDEEDGHAVEVVELLPEQELGRDDVDDERPGAYEGDDGLLDETEGHEVEAVARSEEREGEDADEGLLLDAPLFKARQFAGSCARGTGFCGLAVNGNVVTRGRYGFRRWR